MTCGTTFYSCVCTLEDEHSDHVCPCGGSWRGDGPEREILAYPQRVVAGPYVGTDLDVLLNAGLSMFFGAETDEEE